LGPAGISLLLIAGPIAATVVGVAAFAKFSKELQQSAQGAAVPAGPVLAQQGLKSLSEAADSYRAQYGVPPADTGELYGWWRQQNEGEGEPRDPYTGERFNYTLEEERYLIWSVGPEPANDADDVGWAGDTKAPT